MSNNFPHVGTKGKHKLLLMDPSASHLAYVQAELDLDLLELHITSCGMIWAAPSWSRGQRYIYMQKAVNSLIDGLMEEVPSVVITEAFFSNPKLPMGGSVIPTINAFAEMEASITKAQYLEIGPTTWRSVLSIKPNKDASGKRDYKTPTADLIKKSIQVPDTIASNIHKDKQRKTPHDVTDVLAIALAVAKHHGVTKISQGNVAFYPIHFIDKLSKLAKEI